MGEPRQVRFKTERPVAFFDLECYRNFFYVAFVTEDGRSAFYERSNRADFDHMRVRRILKKYTVVGFNSRDYDAMVLLYALGGASNEQLKKLSDWIIKGRKKPWDCEREFGIVIPSYMDMVDLFDTNPSVGNGSDDDEEVENAFASGSASLKTLGGRLHAKRLQDLPVEPDALLTHEQMDIVADYCLNSDCPATALLYQHCKQALALRELIGETYDIDARSLSDAQTGERMIKIGVERLIKKRIEKADFKGGYSFRYEVPDFIEFETPLLQGVLKVLRETDIQVTDTGSVPFPEAFKKFKIEIGQSSYKLGIGGLHSQEKCRAEFSDENSVLLDWDVGSQYPRIIIKLGMYPKAVGPKFQPVYTGMADGRLADKRLSQEAARAGDREKELFYKVRSDGRKVGLNGPYGKLGSRYSILFAPT